MSDTFVSPDILAGGSYDGTSEGNDYVKPLTDRPVGEVTAMVDRWFRRSIENRRHVENQTLLNLAFYLGQQYVHIDQTSSASRVVPVQRKPGQVRTVDNIIDPAVRQEKARLLRSRPSGDVVPQGNDPADMEAAVAAQMAVQHTFREGGWDEAIEKATDWAVVGGTGHVGAAWDKSLRDSFGQQGITSYRALSPFEIAVPHLRREHIEDQPYVMVTKAYEVDEIEMRWGKRVAADREEQFGSYDQRLRSIVTGAGSYRTPYGTGVSTGYNERIDIAVVKEVWIKPSQMAPKGAVLIVSSGQLLEFTPEWPAWCNGQYPFEKVTYTEVPGSYWGKGLINDLIPLQRRHNRAASVMVELLNKVAHTAISAPRGTKVKSILSGRGTMLEVPPGMGSPAQQLTVPNIGNLPLLEMESTKQASRDISFFHEVSSGTTPPNVRSGTAISALKELDDAAASIPIRSIERATQKMGRLSLSMIKEKWDAGRMMMVVGTEGDVEMRSFVNSSGTGGQYWVTPGSAFPFSKGARMQMLVDMFDRQIISPEEFLLHAEMGTPQSIKQDRYKDNRHARRENQKFEDLSPMDENGNATPQAMQKMIAQVEQMMPAEWHNHVIHLKEHNDLRKSPTYEKWEPWRKQLFEAHISGHRVALEAQMMAQMQGPGGPAREAAGAQQRQRQEQRDAAATASGRMDQLRAQQMQAQQAAAQQAAAQSSASEGSGE